ncbi:MAG: hypothetical protein ACM3SM_07855 [Bacteroidota bacterium]
MIKDIKEILQAGIRLILKNKKFIYLFWGTNFIFSIVLTLPVFYLLNDQLIHSALSKSLDYGFDIVWYIQFISMYRTNIGQIPYLLIGLMSIYVLIQAFFLGGLIAVFNNTKKNHFVDFFYGGVKYWYRFTKVLLAGLLFYALAFWANDMTGMLLTYIFSNQEKIIFEFILRASRYSLLIFIIGVISLFGDYAKIVLAVTDREELWFSVRQVVHFLRSNFWFIFLVFFIVSLMGAFGAAVYNVVNNLLPKSHYIYFILAFILQQMLIIFRLFVRMLFTSTEILLYKDLQAPVISTQAEEILED